MRRMTVSTIWFATRGPAVAVLLAASLGAASLGAASLGVAASGAAPAGAAERPGLDESQAFVGKLADDAVQTWTKHASDEVARLEAMDSLIHAAFDVDFITRAVLGRYWRELDPAERRRFRELFPEFVVQVYLPHIAKYSRDHMRVLGARPRGKRDVVVESELLTDQGDWIEAGWRIRSREDGIRIIDLTVAGVSLLLVQRQEFEAVIRREGFAGLVERLIERKNEASNARG